MCTLHMWIFVLNVINSMEIEGYLQVERDPELGGTELRFFEDRVITGMVFIPDMYLAEFQKVIANLGCKPASTSIDENLRLDLRSYY